MSDERKNDKSYTEAIAERVGERALTEGSEASSIVFEEPPYLLAPNSKAMEEEVLADPTFPWEEGAKPKPGKRGPKLNEDQQMQIAIWLSSGFTYADTVPWQLNEWGFAITRQTWNYYREVRRDLQEKASKWITDQYARFGYANPIVRLARLERHAKLIESYIAKRGLYETEVHIIGGGRGGPQQVTSEKFAKDLSAEWRATMAQIEKMTDAAEKNKKYTPGGAILGVEVDDEMAKRFLLVSGWEPKRKTKDDEEVGE